MAKKEKKTRKRGKRIRKGRKHESVKIHKHYEIKGDSLVRNRDFCPRCGPGVWLSKHAGRSYCGKCGYTSFEGRAPAEVRSEGGQEAKESKPEEVKENKE